MRWLHFSSWICEPARGVAPCGISGEVLLSTGLIVQAIMVSSAVDLEADLASQTRCLPTACVQCTGCRALAVKHPIPCHRAVAAVEGC